MRWQAATVCLYQMAQAVLSHDRSRLQAMPSSRFGSPYRPRWLQAGAAGVSISSSELGGSAYYNINSGDGGNGDSIQVATRADIPEIQQCNRATLPENYNDAFFESHLHDWPDMSFVARGTEGSVLGYVLGRLEYEDRHRTSTSSSVELKKRRRCGHITSLAVSERYRRRGLARKLMAAVHESMIKHYHVERARLHVRCSNHNALRLYSRLGYTIHSVVKGYYADGEAAYLMAADLKLQQQEESNAPSQAIANGGADNKNSPQPNHSSPENTKQNGRPLVLAATQHVISTRGGGDKSSNKNNPLHLR